MMKMGGSLDTNRKKHIEENSVTIHGVAYKVKSIGKDAFKGTAEGLTILIYADKKTYKHIVKMIMDSGKLPKKIKFKWKKN